MKQSFYTFAFLLTSLISFAQTPCVDGMAGEYPCQLVDMMAFVPLSDIGGGDNTNDIWGWKSPASGREYALVGCDNGCAFVDISDPVNPVYIGILPPHPGTENSLWRDVEDFENHAFIVSEASGHGMQVFDLLLLDGVTNPPVEFDETTHFDGFGHCHTIDICEETGFAYCNGTSYFSGGQYIVDINDPLNPTLAGSFADDGYTHDCHAVLYDGPDADYSGDEIVMACNEDAVTVVNCTDKSDCFAISTTPYQGSAYTHQGWFTKDKKHFLVDDELDETDFDVDQRTHIFQVEDLDNVDHLGVYQSELSTIDHNLYIKDHFVFESNYTSGVRILDAVHVAETLLTEIAFFDVSPTNNSAQFAGTWSNYAFLPSGLMLSSDMNDGFFVLRPTMIVTDQNSWSLCGTDEINFLLDVNAEIAFPLTLGVAGLPGDVQVNNATITETSSLTVTLSNLLTVAVGVYDFQLLLITNFGEQYEVPLHLEISAGSAAQPEPLAPAQGSLFAAAADIIFTWEEQVNTTSFNFQLATDNAFNDMVDEQTVDGTIYNPLYDLPEGTYYWRVQANNDCGQSAFSEEWSFDVIVVGVDEIVANALQVYPNPASGTLWIKNAAHAGGIITVRDVAGQVVMQMAATTGRLQSLDISMLAAGVYTVEAGEEVVAFLKGE